mgnify:CR=1 FL=1
MWITAVRFSSPQREKEKKKKKKRTSSSKSQSKTHNNIYQHGTIPPVEAFVVAGPPSSQAAKWKAWLNRLEIYFAALGVVDGRKRALMLHLAGESICDIAQSIPEATPKTYETLKTELTEYFKPMANPDYELFMLRQARQQPEESVD